MPSSAITWQICSRSGGDALAGPVLQRDQPVLGDQSGGLAGERLQRQRLQVRHAAGERDHLGSAGHGEQCPDRRRAHAAGAFGVTLRCAGPGCCRSCGTTSRVRRRLTARASRRGERATSPTTPAMGPNGSGHRNGGPRPDPPQRARRCASRSVSGSSGCVPSTRAAGGGRGHLREPARAASARPILLDGAGGSIGTVPDPGPGCQVNRQQGAV